MPFKKISLPVLISLFAAAGLPFSALALPTAGEATSATTNVVDAVLSETGFTTGKSLIPRLSVVSPKLLRGGQPSRQGFSWLRDNGVKTVINLRGADDGDRLEASETKRLGMQYFNIPVSHFQRVPDAVWNQIDEIISKPQNQPVFIHCAQGQDRTGAICALYRIRHQGWEPQKSYEEMRSFGFHPFFFNLKQQVLGDAGNQRSDLPEETALTPKPLQSPANRRD